MIEIIIPIAGMLFVLSVIYGGRLLTTLDSYFQEQAIGRF